MFSWTPYAFVRILLFFAGGILLGIYSPGILPKSFTEVAFLILAISFIVIAYQRTKTEGKFFNPGVIALMALFLAGSIRVYTSTDSNKLDHILHYTDTIQHYRVVINKQAQEKENSWKIEAKVQAVQHLNNEWKEKTGNVLLYFSKKVYPQPFRYGDILLIEGSPQLLTEPANPGEFNYKRFLTFRKIYHQHFLREGDVLHIGHQAPYAIIDISIRVREWAEEALKKNISGSREQAIASALVLGVTDGLDNELLNAYSATGSMHVLAVSGLHVGIIYGLIVLLLKPLNRTTQGKWVLAIISIVILWSYAFVTALSPSVLRAVTMFSFVALARPWGQRTNIYNTLAASAFCLLMFEPYLIMSVGFQLSYLAVLGIVYLQPKLYRLWEPEYVVWDRIWQITCVSIAAQIGTFSLGLLYFHQFPVYFLFSNLFVIPGAFAVLVLGLAVVFTDFISPIATGLGFLLEWTIRALNFGVFSVEAFPYSLIDNIHITTLQCWLLMCALLAAIFLFEYRKLGFAILAASFVFLFVVIQWNRFVEQVDQKQFVVYKVSGHHAMDMMDRGQAYFLADSVLKADREKLRFHIRPNRLQRGVKRIHDGTTFDFVRDISGGRIVSWRGITILHVMDREFVPPDSLMVDYVVVGKNSIRNMKSLQSIKFDMLVLDSSNSFYFAERIKNEAQAVAIQVHSVLHSGAFIAKR